jgi:type I restriction enzyme R subunit
MQKTIVFCVDEEHADRMRQALVNENADLCAKNHRYVMRITGSDTEGQNELSNFIDPEVDHPVLVTTSRLLSTGVDAQTCRLIVLDRAVGSMTEFKQIIGRGTRVHEDKKKYFFTIMDFRGATNLFAEPEFDGDPVQVYEPGEDDAVTPPEKQDPLDPDVPPEPGAEETVVDTGIDDPAENGPLKKIYVDGVHARVIAERVEYLDADGKLVTESLKDFTKKALRQRFASLNDFLVKWKSADRKQAVVDELEEEGLPLDSLIEEVGKDLDPFDLICHVAFDRPPLTRKERADNVRKRDVFTKYGAQARKVLEALLIKYQDQGIINLDDPKILQIAPFDTMGTPLQLIREFGSLGAFEKAVHELQDALYQTAA